MQKVAYALAGMVKGWHLDEAEIRERFTDAVLKLQCKGEPWTRKHALDKWQRAMREAEPRSWPPSSSKLNGAGPAHSPEDEPPRTTTPYALRLLNEARPAKGTIAEVYLGITRGLSPTGKALEEFRFHPSVKHSGNRCPLPALLAPFRPAPGAKPTGVHVTFLGPNGERADLEKSKRKIIFGTAKGSAIWLGPAAPHMLIAEGNEKTLACMSASGLPGISGGSSSIMVGASIPPGTGTVTICADRGEAGEGKAQRLASRLYDEGLEVRICFPPIEGKDWDESAPADVKAAIEGAPAWEPGPEKEEGWAAQNGAHSGGTHGGNGGGARGRDEPLPLVRPLDPAPEYPVDALGPLLGEAAKALHREIVQAPLAVCCNAVLAAATLAVQGHADVGLPHEGVRPVSLYILSVLETGGRKTSTDDHALKAVSDYEAELRERYDEKCAAYQNRFDAWKAEREKIKRNKHFDLARKTFELDALGREPPPPPFPLLRYSEPSIEGLIQSLRYGHPSAGLFTSEGGQFIGGHAMSDDAKMRSTTTLNRFWDGAPADRIRASERFLLVGRRLCIHLQAQPDVAMAMIADRALRDNGFLSRFLISAPVSLAGTRFAKPVSDESRAALHSFTQRVLLHLRRELPYVQGKNCLELKPRVLRFSDEAAALWWSFYDHIEAELKAEGSLAPVAGLANKLPEHAGRIAAVLAAAEDEHTECIGAHHLERGIQIAQYYAEEALRIAGAASVNVQLANAQKLLDWLHTKWSEECIAIAPLVEFGPYAFRDTAVMKRLVATLIEYNWLIPAAAGTIVHKRPRKEVWKIVKAEARAHGL
jgi:hypothetical protein